jgi:peptide/nickel transport system substrate-binding protein
VTDEMKPIVGDFFNKRLTRREVPKGAAIAGAVAGLPSLAAACGGASNHQSSASPTASVSPKTGGSLRVGLTGGSSADSLDALSPMTLVDDCRQLQLYDALVTCDTHAKIVPALVEEVTPDSDATVFGGASARANVHGHRNPSTCPG